MKVLYESFFSIKPIKRISKGDAREIEATIKGCQNVKSPTYSGI